MSEHIYVFKLTLSPAIDSNWASKYGDAYILLGVKFTEYVVDEICNITIA